jgi:hypothetical protein
MMNKNYRELLERCVPVFLGVRVSSFIRRHQNLITNFVGYLMWVWNYFVGLVSDPCDFPCLGLKTQKSLVFRFCW